MSTLASCSTVETGPIYHTFSIEVAKEVGRVRNLKYHYGDLGWRQIPVAAAPGPISSQALEMAIPLVFEVSWDSESGRKYEFHIPIKERLPGSISHKTIRMVIVTDGVEGYVITYDGPGVPKRERFY